LKSLNVLEGLVSNSLYKDSSLKESISNKIDNLQFGIFFASILSAISRPIAPQPIMATFISNFHL
jgi:hypothetical protein